MFATFFNSGDKLRGGGRGLFGSGGYSGVSGAVIRGDGIPRVATLALLGVSVDFTGQGLIAN